SPVATNTTGSPASSASRRARLDLPLRAPPTSSTRPLTRAPRAPGRGACPRAPSSEGGPGAREPHPLPQGATPRADARGAAARPGRAMLAARVEGGRGPEALAMLAEGPLRTTVPRELVEGDE